MIPLQIDTCILKNDVDDITDIALYDIFKGTKMLDISDMIT